VRERKCARWIKKPLQMTRQKECGAVEGRIAKEQNMKRLMGIHAESGFVAARGGKKSRRVSKIEGSGK